MRDRVLVLRKRSAFCDAPAAKRVRAALEAGTVTTGLSGGCVPGDHPPMGRGRSSLHRAAWSLPSQDLSGACPLVEGGDGRNTPRPTGARRVRGAEVGAAARPSLRRVDAGALDPSKCTAPVAP